MTVIQIRGTSGSGKSTVMRRVMDHLEWNSHFVTGRKRPLYYTSVDPERIAVIGHYESPCGGGDSIDSARACYELITQLLDYTVLCEGLLLSEDVKWSLQLPDLRVIFLTTPLGTCLDWIKERRAKAGNAKELSISNTANRVRTIDRARLKLIAAGARCRRATADQAVGIVLKWIRAYAVSNRV